MLKDNRCRSNNLPDRFEKKFIFISILVAKVTLCNVCERAVSAKLQCILTTIAILALALLALDLKYSHFHKEGGDFP